MEIQDEKEKGCGRVWILGLSLNWPPQLGRCPELRHLQLGDNAKERR